jgi:hypothetical protein
MKPRIYTIIPKLDRRTTPEKLVPLKTQRN